MVTKQEQLEWLAKAYKTWPEQGATSLRLSVVEVGKFAIVNAHTITKQEWQQERDKMSSKPGVDNSWHERGELPPTGCECEVLYRGEWFAITVIGIDSSGYCVFEVPDHMYDGAPYDGLGNLASFRPLRTEREKAIEEMAGIICAGGYFTNHDGAAKTIAERIYDAGFRNK